MPRRVALRGAPLHPHARAELLEHTRLDFAHLERTRLHFAHLDFAWLDWAHLEGAQLTEAKLEGAVFARAHLDGAWLLGAYFDQTTSLTAASLRGGAVKDVDLSTLDLTQDQINSLFGDDTTILPSNVTPPAWHQDSYKDPNDFIKAWRAHKEAHDIP